jgi:AraC-like DNA-binding protein
VGERVAVQLDVRPAPALRPYVSSYIGYHLRGFPAGLHLGTPTQAMTAVVSLSEPLDLAVVPGSLPQAGRFASVGSGLTSRSVAISHDGNQHGVQISLTPAGARAIYGMPAAALVDTLVPLDDLLGHVGAELVDRLAGTASWDERFAALDQVFLRKLGRSDAGRHGPHQVRPEVAEAWRRMVAARGQVHVETIATDLAWSRRHLSRQFRHELGLTPKTMARILRFEHAHQLAVDHDPLPWAQISAVAGYADQAHLVRDWREFTGRSPTAWRRGEVLGGPGKN